MAAAKAKLRQKSLSLNTIIVKQRKSTQYKQRRKNRFFRDSDDRVKAIELRKLEIRLAKETLPDKRAELSKEITKLAADIKESKKAILEKKERDAQV